MTTNKLVWRFRWPEQCYSGSTATAGGLVFVGRNDGRLTALDSKTGKQLWEFQTGAGMHAAVSTVERNGRQYVLAYSAGNALIGSARGDSVWMFGLDGTLPPAEAGSPLRRTPDQLRDAAAPASRGRRRTRLPTSRAASGSSRRPARSATAMTASAARAAASRSTTSRAPPSRWRPSNAGRNNMPAFQGTLSVEQIRDVAAYVFQRLSREHAPE